jgi:hypothetical protein
VATTEYVVLRQVQDDDDAIVWQEVIGGVEASNDQQAIRSATLNSEKAGTFVAVPKRSFRPRTRTVETKEIDRWA